MTHRRKRPKKYELAIIELFLSLNISISFIYIKNY